MKFRRNYEYFYQKPSRPQKKGKRPLRGRDPRLKTADLDETSSKMYVLIIIHEI